MIGRALAVALVLVPALALADPAKDRAAVTQFEAAYQATAKLAGPARTNQACKDAATLCAAGMAFSHDTAPADAPVDNAAWQSAAGGLGGSLDNLTKVCKAPDRKLALLGGKSKTADQVVQELDADVKLVLDSARPRTLPPELKIAEAALAAIQASTRSICTQLPKLARALARSAKPPAGVANAAWKEPYQTAKNISAELKSAACGAHRAADEQIGSSLGELHDNFYKLVLLVPPR